MLGFTVFIAALALIAPNSGSTAAHAGQGSGALVSLDTHGAAGAGETAYFTTPPGNEVRARFTFTAESDALLRIADPFPHSNEYGITDNSTCKLNRQAFLQTGVSCELEIRYMLERYPGYNVAFGTVTYDATPADSSGTPLPGGIAQQMSQPVAFYPNPFEVTPINFGTVEVGTSQRQMVRITNAHSPSTHGFTAHIRGDAFSAPEGIYGTLAPGEFVELPVEFLPTLLGGTSASLVPAYVNMNAGELINNPYGKMLNGVGGAPAVTIEAPDLSFGDVQVGGSVHKEMKITNTGSVATSVSVTNLDDLAVANVSLDLAENTVIASGETATAQVTWAPKRGATNVLPSIGITHAPFTDPAGSTGPIAPISVGLAGEPIAPDASVSIAPVDFGSVTLGDVAEQSLVFTNSSTEAVTLQLDEAQLENRGLATAATVTVPAESEIEEVITWAAKVEQQFRGELEYEEVETGAIATASLHGIAQKKADKPNPGRKPETTNPGSTTPGGSPKTEGKSADRLVETGGGDGQMARLAATTGVLAGAAIVLLSLHRRRQPKQP